MSDHPVVASAVEGYLDAVATELVGPAATRAAILDELRDGLHAAITSHLQAGADRDDSVRAALREFGPPATTAAAFGGELAGARARRTAAAYLLTGPVVGLLWLLTLTPTGWWPDRPAAIWEAIPATPAIAIAAAAGVAVLAATGRPSRWLQPAPHQILHATMLVIAVAALADLLMLALTMMSGAPLPAIGIAAVAASLVRLGCGLAATSHCVRTRRILLRGAR